MKEICVKSVQQSGECHTEMAYTEKAYTEKAYTEMAYTKMAFEKSLNIDSSNERIVTEEYSGEKANQIEEKFIGMKNDITVKRLISVCSSHAGASSFYIDNAFSTLFLQQLDDLFLSLPIAPAERGAIECASRSYFCDSLGYVTDAIASALKHIKSSTCCKNEVENALSM